MLAAPPTIAQATTPREATAARTTIRRTLDGTPSTEGGGGICDLPAYKVEESVALFDVSLETVDRVPVVCPRVAPGIELVLEPPNRVVPLRDDRRELLDFLPKRLSPSSLVV